MRDFTKAPPDLNGKGILITGGTGSFGHRFVKTVLARYKPARLVVFSRDEMKQYDMEHQFPIAAHPAMRYFLGDVRDKERLSAGDARHRHRDPRRRAEARAGGRVQPDRMHPDQHTTGRRTSSRPPSGRGVRRVVALSTDKAANPINLYGASQAGGRQAVRRRQRAGRQGRHALRHRALRQRGRFARLGRAVLPPPGRRGRAGAADHRRAHDAVLDHAAAGRRFRAVEPRHDDRAARSSFPVSPA